MPVEYDLFIDESGTFTETSTKTSERDAYPRNAPPSQLAGVLAPHGALDRRAAESLIARAAQECGIAAGGPGPWLHATDVRDPLAYRSAVRLIATECRNRGWQPVRLVNAEGVVFGDRVATYTSMLAELVMRIFRRKLLEGEPHIRFHITTATVVWPVSDAELGGIEHADYERRLREQLAFVNIRHGLAREAARCEVASLKIGSGRDRFDLQICDWISNASYGNFRRCDGVLAQELRDLFGDYSQTLYLRGPLELAEQYATQGAHGLAVLSGQPVYQPG